MKTQCWGGGASGQSSLGPKNEPEEQKPRVVSQESGNERGAGALSHPNPR